MAEFKLENNVPNYYVEESRDFQLLCRIVDIYLKGCLSKSSYLPYQLDLDTCSEQLLYAVAYMQGFTTKMYIPPNILRNILKVFPYCIKRKGTEEAIRAAAYAVLSTDRLLYLIDVSIRSNTGIPDSSYVVTITCNAQSEYLPYLREVLTFILPAGWRVVYQLLNTLTKTADPVKIAVENRFTRLSGITGRIMSESPYKPVVEDNPTAKKGKMSYSRIGVAKVIRSRTVGELMGNEGYMSEDYVSPTGANAFEKLLSEDGKTIFISNNLKREGDSIGG